MRRSKITMIQTGTLSVSSKGGTKNHGHQGSSPSGWLQAGVLEGAQPVQLPPRQFLVISRAPRFRRAANWTSRSSSNISTSASISPRGQKPSTSSTDPPFLQSFLLMFLLNPAQTHPLLPFPRLPPCFWPAPVASQPAPVSQACPLLHSAL